ncbi:xanthine dehydrogenase family protein molybdopterin-binding subunit [Bordetella genomosp. 13]|uniref:xanthine dehydrogenase family protein molybdopterin-binding subunit n=1 Tax=Bordetella genomosp. 13 TaxID=463040 RepID=UPI0011A19B23|nr:molybdopterin cofactor-binding domain-containing protein [Bordetella genomosp. 13]
MDSYVVLPEHPIHNVSRRRFMPAAGGLVLGLSIGPAGARAAAAANARQVTAAFSPNAFVRVGTDGWVTVLARHMEVDQDVHAGLATLVAEELDADWRQVRVEGTHIPPAASRGAAMAESYLPLRRAGAAARAMLVSAAAQQWRVPAEEIVVHEGIVRHPGSQRQAGIGHLAAAAATLPAPQDSALKPSADFRLIGKEGVGRADNPAKTNGTAVFAQDFKLPGMLVALAARPPRPGARLASYDGQAARALPGVRAVVEVAATPQHPALVAVLADDTWSAHIGRDALRVRWDDSQADTANSDQMLAGHLAAAQRAGDVVVQRGEVEAAFAAAARVIEADFHLPCLARAAMEPLSCLVRLEDRRCDIWSGEPVQAADQLAIARYLKLPVGGVALTALHAADAFGRRGASQAGALIEAVAIARAARRAGLDAPIKQVWTREDDMRGGHCRPMRLQRARLALDAAGKPTAWHARMVGASLAAPSAKADPAWAATHAGVPYAVAHLRIEQHAPREAGMPAPWRADDATHAVFAAETLIDEAAHAAGQDPVAYRDALLSAHPRLRRVLARAARESSWGQPLPGGAPDAPRGRGIALHACAGGAMALVAELTVRPGRIKVDRVVCAVDGGVPINPDVVRAQVESGIGFGLAGCLHGAITLKDGAVQQGNFHDFPVLRMDEMPVVDVHVLPSSEAPAGGAADMACAAIAPAVGNALYAAVARRLHALPFCAALGVSPSRADNSAIPPDAPPPPGQPRQAPHEATRS